MWPIGIHEWGIIWAWDAGARGGEESQSLHRYLIAMHRVNRFAVQMVANPNHYMMRGA